MKNLNSNKSGVVTLTMFSLIIVAVLFILIFSYFFYDYVKDQGIKNKKSEEVLNSITSFRSELLTTIKFPNSNLTYTNKYDTDDILITLKNNTINGLGDYGTNSVTMEISTLGPNFCSNYSFSPIDSKIFTFNGSCIKMLN